MAKRGLSGSHLKPLKQHFNRKAISELPFLVVLYYAASPIVWLAFRLGISANQLTLMSLLAGAASFAALAMGSASFFVTLWTISYLLDFVDGPIARITGSARKFIVRKDYLADLFRIGLLPAGFGLFYDDNIVWIAAFFATFGFLFYSVVGNAVSKNASHDLMVVQPAVQVDRKIPTGFVDRVFGNRPRLRMVVKPFFEIHSHTFLLYFFVPFSQLIGTICLVYVAVLSLAHSARIIWKYRRIVEVAD